MSTQLRRTKGAIRAAIFRQPSAARLGEPPAAAVLATAEQAERNDVADPRSRAAAAVK